MTGAQALAPDDPPLKHSLRFQPPAPESTGKQNATRELRVRRRRRARARLLVVPTSVSAPDIDEEEAAGRRRGLRRVPPQRRGRERAAGGRGHGRAPAADPRAARGGGRLGATGRVGGVGPARHVLRRRRHLRPRRRAASAHHERLPRRRRGDRRRAGARRAFFCLHPRHPPPRRIAGHPLQPVALKPMKNDRDSLLRASTPYELRSS
jgi:hypothetical protein